MSCFASEGVLRAVSPRCTCPFDMLRETMREMYYRLAADGLRPTRMTAGREALCGYEMLSEQNDPPVTTFKDLVVAFDPTVPLNVMRFLKDEELVGEIGSIS